MVATVWVRHIVKIFLVKHAILRVVLFRGGSRVCTIISHREFSFEIILQSVSIVEQMRNMLFESTPLQIWLDDINISLQNLALLMAYLKESLRWWCLDTGPTERQSYRHSSNTGRMTDWDTVLFGSLSHKIGSSGAYIVVFGFGFGFGHIYLTSQCHEDKQKQRAGLKQHPVHV